MKMLITGGLGYIGGRIANYFKGNSLGTDIVLTTRNTNREPAEWCSGLKIMRMDVLDLESIHSCLDGIDTVIHLAAINEIESMQDPEKALEVNTKGTFNLLNMARVRGVKRFIYFSTFHVYGQVVDSVITEEIPTRPFHPYAITHRAAEDFVRYFNHYFGLPILIFRLSNGYGYPMDKNVQRWSLVFNDFCKQAVVNKKIVIKSSGKQCRDFISLEDVARAIHHFLSLPDDAWGDGLYNLGGNCSMSIEELAQRIASVYQQQYSGGMVEIEIRGAETEPAISFAYGIGRLLKTGFYLQGNMEEEIRKTLSACSRYYPKKF